MNKGAGLSSQGRKKRRLKPLSTLSKRQLRRRVAYSDDESSGNDDCSESAYPPAGSPSSSSSRLSCGFSSAGEEVSEHVDNGGVESVNGIIGLDGDDTWFDAEENDTDPNCKSCGKCVCLDCALCFHSEIGCVVYESDLELEYSDDGDGDFVDVGSVSDSDDSAEESLEQAEEGGLAASLTDWVNIFKVPFKHVTALLKILVGAHIAGLPNDARTLMNTPRVTTVCTMFSGSYWHNCLAKCLQRVLKGSNVAAVEVSVNVDGLPLFKSSGSQLWPSLCSVFDKVFLVGAYHGDKKPDDSNVFLDKFVAEAKAIVTEGVLVDGRKVNVSVKKLVCDAPAKSDVMKVPGHGAYCSCTKCKVEGIYKNRRIAFPDLNAPLRTDQEFKDQVDSDHHTGISTMLEIPGFGGVTNVVLDYMHLVCLGVMRKLLVLWIKGPLKTRVGNAYITAISSMLTKISGLKPREFCRPPRSLKYVLQFKATEFRQLLLYTGPIVFYDCLPPDIYLNFMKLHVALVILCSPQFAVVNDFLNYANDLLKNFVEEFSDIYGEEFVSHNVHNLIHLVQDVRNFGPLDHFSAFCFENFMQYLKKLVRKPNKVLAQISRRITERESLLPILSRNNRVFEPHTGGILPRSCENPQFKRIHFPNFVLYFGEPNNCCGFSGREIMVIENFATWSRLKCVVAVGRVFQEKENLYDQSLPSSSLGFFKVQKLGRVQFFPVDDIVTKYWKIPIGNDGAFGVFPLLHHETPL